MTCKLTAKDTAGQKLTHVTQSSGEKNGDFGDERRRWTDDAAHNSSPELEAALLLVSTKNHDWSNLLRASCLLVVPTLCSFPKSFVFLLSSFEHNDARTANENAAWLLHHYVQLFSILGALGLFRYDMLLICNMA